MIEIALINIFVLVVLLLSSYLDVKYREIPAVLLTATLIVVFAVFHKNLVFGILAGLVAWIIYDLLATNSYEFGMADIKIMCIIGLMIATFEQFFFFLIIFAIVQFIYVFIFAKIKKDTRQIPFVPCLTIIYIIMILAL